MDTPQENHQISEDPNFVSKAKASEIASRFFASDVTTKGAAKSVATIDAINDESGAPLMYVINYTGGGFVVLSATKEYNPVLAFSEDNLFTVNYIDGGVTVWLAEKKFDITEVKKGISDSAIIKNIALEWARYEMHDAAQSTPPATTKAITGQIQMMADRIHEFNDRPDNNYSFSDIRQCGGFYPLL